MDFYNYLKSQFSNLEEAKAFFKKWKDEWDQEIPNHPEWEFSMRAMAGHISCCLTGDEYQGFYLETKYGSDIFFS